MKTTIRLISAIFLLSISAVSFAEIAIIVHPDNKMDKIEVKQAAQIFLKKVKKFPVGGKANPVVQKDGSSVFENFNKIVLKKSASTLKAYWSKVIFTGKAVPPKTADTDEDVIKIVSSDKEAIGYIDSSKVNASVKVILTVK